MQKELKANGKFIKRYLKTKGMQGRSVRDSQASKTENANFTPKIDTMDNRNL